MVTFLFFLFYYISMTGILTKQEFSLYSLLYLKFGKSEFDLGGLRWYFSKQMLKKLVFNLVESNWLKSVRKGVYKCIAPDDGVKGLFEQRIEEELQKAGLKYGFTKASAAEIWSDETYVQRSWEYSPFFVKVLKKDLGRWKKFLEKKEIKYFVGQSANAVGEFVVLESVSSLEVVLHDDKPVEPLKETAQFCEKNKDSFEYVLAYFSQKYGKKTSASKEMLEKVGEAI
jgi:hypothetical protein